MNAYKLIFSWYDFSIHSNGQDEYTLSYQGREASRRTIHTGAPVYSADWLGDLIIHLTDEAAGVPDGQREILVGLGEDLLSNPEMLDWWVCTGCGRSTFLVPDDEAVCVWCGTVASG